MEDKFVVKNKSGTVLNIPNHKLRLSINAEVDLVSRLEKTTVEIKRDKDILRELTFNNLEILEEYDSSKKDYNIEQKIDSLINILSEKKENNIDSIKEDIINALENKIKIDESLIEKTIQNKISNIKLDNNSVDDNKKNIDEEKMREQALLELLNKEKSYEVKDFGKERKIDGDQEDFSDMVDF